MLAASAATSYSKSKSKLKLKHKDEDAPLSADGSDAPIVCVHKHQHTHTHYVHAGNTPNPRPSSCCDARKFVIYALLFFVAYYLLFLGIEWTYKRHKSAYDDDTPSALDLIGDHSVAAYGELVQITEDGVGDTPSAQRERFLERKRKRRAERKKRVAAKQIDAEQERIYAEHPDLPKCCAEGGGALRYEAHEPFPALFISDAPFYMGDNLVIMGQLKDSEAHLRSVLAQLSSVACLFNSTTFVLFESNSRDNTSAYLEAFAQQNFNCSAKRFAPHSMSQFGDLHSLDDLLALFDEPETDVENAPNGNATAENGYDHADEFLHAQLQNMTSMAEIDLHELAWLLSEHLIAHRAQQPNAPAMSSVEVEEIVHDKLAPIQFAKYRHRVARHSTHIRKVVITGDDIVADELAEELAILKQLKIYDGVNEFHQKTDRAYRELEKLRAQHSHGDVNAFAEEFDAIHTEMEGLLGDDDEMAHLKLREKQLAFARKRKQLRARQLEKNNARRRLRGDDGKNKETAKEKRQREKLERQRYDEYYVRFRDSLYRIERFVVYRNMLLAQAKAQSAAQGVHFDWVMNVDMDIFNIDLRTFMSELYYATDNEAAQHEIDGLCIDGIDWMGYTRDTFATVRDDGAWLHYGHSALNNDTEYRYHHQHAMHQRRLTPNVSRRFEPVRSCFGGVSVFRNRQSKDLLASQCRYTLTRDIFWTEYDNVAPEGWVEEVDAGGFRYDESWWAVHRHHNAYSAESLEQLAAFRGQYVELLQSEDKRIKNRANYPRDGDICEHIPYQYCLADIGFKMAISSRARLYYVPYYPVNRAYNDTNWDYYWAHRPSFTKAP